MIRFWGDPGAASLIVRAAQAGRILWAAAVILLFAALTAFMTYPQIRFMDDAVAIYEGDALFSTWRLAWVAHELPRDPFNLFNANIFYPEKGSLAFSDAMIVPALMAAPLLWAGVPQIAYLQHHLSFRIRAVGRRNVPAGPLADGEHAGGPRLRVHLRLPAVSLHALRASRTADFAVDAALPVGPASNDEERPRA